VPDRRSRAFTLIVLGNQVRNTDCSIMGAVVTAGGLRGSKRPGVGAAKGRLRKATYS
jgi:hypothetical protein